MPFDARYEAGENCAVLTATDPLDVESSRAVFAALAEILAGHPDAGILVDIRGVNYTPSPGDIREFVAHHLELTRKWRNAHAMVSSPGADFGMARMLASLVEVAGGRSRAFTRMEEARQWLHETMREKPSGK